MRLAKILLSFIASWCCLSIAAQGPISDGDELAPSLRALAEPHGLLIGTCAFDLTRDGLEPEYTAVLAREFNIVTPENEMKFGSLCPRARGDYDFAAADALVDFAEQHGMRVHGHTLAWGKQNPDWLTQGEWTRDELIEILREHIQTLVGRYRGRIHTWDVVNEHLEDTGWMESPWQKGIGPEYLDMAFRWAREADPDALLIYNDFGIEHGREKFDRALELVRGLKERGVPIDGVGFQAHLSTSGDLDPRLLAEAFRKLAELGLQAQITEMDVRIDGEATPEHLARQAELYRRALEVVLAEPNANVLIMWGFTDRHSWIPEHTGGQSGHALILDEEYQPKPAYEALREGLTYGLVGAPSP